jgi:hypothetical protein
MAYLENIKFIFKRAIAANGGPTSSWASAVVNGDCGGTVVSDPLQMVCKILHTIQPGTRIYASNLALPTLSDR